MDPDATLYFQNQIGIHSISSFGRYLGFAVKDGQLKKEDFIFILDKVKNKLDLE